MTLFFREPRMFLKIMPSGLNTKVNYQSNDNRSSDKCLVRRTKKAELNIFPLLLCFVDNENPKWDGCPNDIYKTTAQNPITVTWTPPTASDNVAVTSQASTKNPGDSFPIGSLIVRYTARDASGNSADCSFTVNVKSK